MKIYEFGKENTPVILLLHGGGLSWWNYREAAQRLEDRFHVVLPVLDGHAGSGDDFVSLETNADRIIDYIDANFGGHILALGGLSLGAQVACAVLARRADICDYALIESVSLLPSRLTHALIGPAFGSSYFLVRYRWFSRLQFLSLRMKEAYFEDYYRDTCGITKENMIAFMKANTAFTLPAGVAQSRAKLLVAVGGKEQRSMLRSTRMLCDAKPGTELYIAEGLYHGELSLNHPEKYVELLEKLVSGD